MTDIDDEEQTRPEYNMGTEEQLLATSIYQAITDLSRYSARSEQSANFKAGISDLGYCSERTRRLLANEVPLDVDVLKMFIGTALGDWMEQAAAKMWPHAIVQSEVTLRLDGEYAAYNIVGHPDIILPDGILIDNKTSHGLALARRQGPSQSQQFQRHCYAKAAHQAGLFDEGVELADVKVANAWLDRAGEDQGVFVEMEPYDEGVVEAATRWLDDVVYAFAHGETARKEPAYEVCRKTCGFFGTCRASEAFGEGLLTDPSVLAALDMYQEGLVLAKAGAKLKKEGKAGLQGVAGSTGEYAVSWTHVNGTSVAYDRSGYQKLNIRKLR